MKKHEVLPGQQFGQLTALEKVSPGRLKKSTWLCRCSCGSERSYLPYRLATGKSWRCTTCAKKTTKSRLTHGGKDTRLYGVYTGMLARCHNKKDKSYVNYGGRGIKVCQRWLGTCGFQHFRDDLGEPGGALTIDRQDNAGDYTPENCRWVDKKTQCRNRRSNVLVSWEGRDWVLVELTEHLGLPYSTIYNRRFYCGWTWERALTEPIQKPSRRKKGQS